MYKMTHSTLQETMTAAEAKAHFADLLRLAEKGEVVLITRYGKPVAALVGPGDIALLMRLRSRAPEDGLAGLVGRWQDSEELVEELEGVRDPAGPGRSIPEFD
jgi:prevent-host-death family protein